MTLRIAQLALVSIASLALASGCIVSVDDDDGNNNNNNGGSNVGGASGGSDTGGDNTGGTGGDGSEEIPEGPPGTVGNVCDAGSCDAGLICGTSDVCQPEATALPAEVVQAVPIGDSADIPKSSPLLLFLDGSYASVTFGVEAYTADGIEDLTNSVAVEKLVSGADKDVYVLSALGGYPLGSSVVVTIGGDITGSIVFNVDHASPAYADADLGFETAAGAKNSCDSTNQTFEALPAGWTGFGDTGVIPKVGSLDPTEGDRLLAMTTGTGVCGGALGGTSSLLVSGPIQGVNNSVTFDYNFQSSEFDDYCASDFDDTLIAVLSGPNGIVAEVVNSVNLVCLTGQAGDAQFDGQPDGGDTVYKETGVTSHTMAGVVGSPATLSFVITDVGDDALSSVVGIDNIRP